MLMDICAGDEEPQPTDGKSPVYPALAHWLRKHGYADSVLRLVRQRRARGLETYGTELYTENGRDPINDALQEAGDLLMYLMQARLEGRDCVELLPAILTAMGLVLED